MQTSTTRSRGPKRAIRLLLGAGLAIGVIGAGLAAIPDQVFAQESTPVTTERAAHEALVRRFFAVASHGDLDTLDELVAPDFTVHTAPPGEDVTLTGLKQTFATVRSGLPDFTFQVDDLLVDGNVVVVRTTITGTHLGDYFDSPPTGNRIETTAIDVWHVEAGRLAANWHLEDILSVTEQLAAAPAGATTSAAVSSSAPATAAGSAVPLDAATRAANVALARRFHDELFLHGNVDAAADILAPGFVWHQDADVVRDSEGAKAAVAATRAAFSDLMLTADQIVAEGDRVAILWTLRGTHQGDYLGVPATGNRISTPGLDIYRIEDGRIAELWTVGDDLGLLIQLGALDFGAPPATPRP